MKSIHEQITNENLATGTNTLSSTPVLPARIQEIKFITYSYTGTVTNVRFEIKAAGKTLFKTNSNPVSGQIEMLTTDIFLSQNEKIDLVITNATATDDATLIIHGVELVA